WLVRHDLDPGVGDVRAVRTGDDGVEVELGDLGQVLGEPGDTQQQVAQRVLGRGREIRGRGAAVAAQRRRRADGTDQRVGIGGGERGEAGRVVRQDVGGAAAGAED